MQKTDKGFTLFYRDSQKLDKLIYLLTEERGLFIAVAKGAKKGKNRFGGSLEPLNEIEMNLYEKENSEFPILEKVNLIENNTPIFDTIDNYNYLMAIIEIIIKLTPQRIRQDKMLRLLKAVIKTLKENKQQVKKLFNYFLVWFLRIEGYLPEFDTCYKCGKKYESFNKFYLSSDGSKILCGKCKTKNSIEIPLSINNFLKVSKSMPPINFISVKFDNEKKIMNFLLKIVNINGEININSLKQLS